MKRGDIKNKQRNEANSEVTKFASKVGTSGIESADSKEFQEDLRQ